MATFKIAPIYTVALESENQIINLDHLERVFPHANVPVGGEEIDTEACEIRFYSGDTAVVLVSFATMQAEIQAITGAIDLLGNEA